MAREIKFEDIKKGDDIEARYSWGGVTCTRRGIAHQPVPHAWYAEAEGLIANDYEDGWKFYLHSRPAPEEPKGLGAVVRAKVAASPSGPRMVRALVRAASGRCAWIDDFGFPWAWSDFDPDSIEVLSEGIEVE